MPVRYTRVPALLIVALCGVMALCGGAAAGQEGVDMRLSDFGFIMRPANTPEQMKRLKLLPARTFLTRVKNERRYYLYADPDYCQCVLVGGIRAMKNYLAFAAPGPLAPMPLGPDGGPVAGSLIQEIDPSLQIFDDDLFDAPFNYPD